MSRAWNFLKDLELRKHNKMLWRMGSKQNETFWRVWRVVKTSKIWWELIKTQKSSAERNPQSPNGKTKKFPLSFYLLVSQSKILLRIGPLRRVLAPLVDSFSTWNLLKVRSSLKNTLWNKRKATDISFSRIQNYFRLCLPLISSRCLVIQHYSMKNFAHDAAKNITFSFKHYINSSS